MYTNFELLKKNHSFLLVPLSEAGPIALYELTLVQFIYILYMKWTWKGVVGTLKVEAATFAARLATAAAAQ